MTATAYVPQPGTIPARVIAHLRSLPPGTEVPGGVLADTLDIDAGSLGPCLNPARGHGLLVAQKRDGRNFWRLGDGAAPASSEEPDDAPPIQRTVKAQQGGVALPDVPRWPGLDAPSAPIALKKGTRLPRAKTAPPAPAACQDGTAEAPAPVISPAAPPKGMRVALWSDGSLQIQRSVGDVIVLTVDETRHLLHYLERLGESTE